MTTRAVIPPLNEIGASMIPQRPIPQNMNDYFGGMTTNAPPSATSFNAGLFGNSEFLNTDRIDNGQKVNEVIPHHFIMAPDLNPADAGESAEAIKTIGIGMLLFSRKHFVETTDPRGSYMQSAQITTSTNATQFLEWTQMARWLANHSARYKNAEDVLNEWKFSGGLKVEVTPNNRGNYGKRAHTRLINATVRGPFMTFNIWATRLAPGQPVFFLVVKGPADSCFAVPRGKNKSASETKNTSEPQPGSYQMAAFDFMKYWETGEFPPPAKRARVTDYESEPSSEHVEAVRNYVWKIVPWTDPMRARPNLRELTFEDIEDGRVVQKVGSYIRAGYALYSEGSPAPGAMRSNGDFASTIGLFNRGLLSQCEICIGI